jgi:hypothetical protein
MPGQESKLARLGAMLLIGDGLYAMIHPHREPDAWWVGPHAWKSFWERSLSGPRWRERWAQCKWRRRCTGWCAADRKRTPGLSAKATGGYEASSGRWRCRLLALHRGFDVFGGVGQVGDEVVQLAVVVYPENIFDAYAEVFLRDVNARLDGEDHALVERL